MSRPSNNQPSQAAAPDFHCSADRSRRRGEWIGPADVRGGSPEETGSSCPIGDIHIQHVSWMRKDKRLVSSSQAFSVEPKGIEPSTSRMPSAKIVRLKNRETTCFMRFPRYMVRAHSLHVNAQN